MATPIANAHIRIARPTNDFAGVKHFYGEGLGFEVLYEFKDHQGFDGVMLGLASHAYHLEFTCKAGHDAGRSPSEDNLLVFYIPDTDVWKSAIARMTHAGFQAVSAFNPYWDRHGRTFEDPDGYHVVLQNTGWTTT